MTTTALREIRDMVIADPDSQESREKHLWLLERTIALGLFREALGKVIRAPAAREHLLDFVRHLDQEIVGVSEVTAAIRQAEKQAREEEAGTPNPSPRPDPSVYFIQAVNGGLIKIGWAMCPKRRLKAIDPFSPTPLQIIGVIPGGAVKEASLHKQFSHLRERGEWFRPESDLLQFIHDNATKVVRS